MKAFNTNYLPELNQVDFSALEVSDYFITRTSTPRDGAIYMKMMKTSANGAILVEATRNHSLKLGTQYLNINPADRVFSCASDAFQEEVR